MTRTPPHQLTKLPPTDGLPFESAAVIRQLPGAAGLAIQEQSYIRRIATVNLIGPAAIGGYRLGRPTLEDAQNEENGNNQNQPIRAHSAPPYTHRQYSTFGGRLEGEERSF